MDRIRLWAVGGVCLYALATLAWCLSHEVSDLAPPVAQGAVVLLVLAGGVGAVFGAVTVFGVRLRRVATLVYTPVPDTPEDDYDDLPRTASPPDP
jgi:hypothetical protein